MPDAVLITIAEAVKDVLDAATLSQTFTPTRQAQPRVELTTLNELYVVVVPIGRVGGPITRDKRKEGTYTVDIGILKKCNVDDNAITDPLVYLGEEIGDLFVDAGPLTGYTSATCLRWDNVDGAKAGFAPEHMNRLRQFTGVVRLTFKVLG